METRLLQKLFLHLLFTKLKIIIRNIIKREVVEVVITIQSKELDIRGIGGIKASAIATPTIISVIAVVMLIHQLFQAKPQQ
jgi:hypothetical protein